MLNKVREEMTWARKNGEGERTKVLSMILGALQKNATAEEKQKVSELDVLVKYKKQVQESLELILDDAKRVPYLNELEVISSLLPKEPSDEELAAGVEEFKALPNFGDRMKKAKEKYPTIDGKKLSALLK